MILSKEINVPTEGKDGYFSSVTYEFGDMVRRVFVVNEEAMQDYAIQEAIIGKETAILAEEVTKYIFENNLIDVDIRYDPNRQSHAVTLSMMLGRRK